MVRVLSNSLQFFLLICRDESDFARMKQAVDEQIAAIDTEIKV